MAIFQLTIHDFCASPEDKKVDLSLTTGAKNEQINNYKYALTGFSMKKQMYQPTEVIADIQISMTAGDSVDFEFIGKDELVALFKGKKSSLELMPDLASNQKDPLFTIGND